MWRVKIFPVLTPKKKQNAIVIGSGKETDELYHEVNNNDLYSFYFTNLIETENFNRGLIDVIRNQSVSLVVADIHDPEIAKMIPNLYNLIFSDVRFVEKHKIYESIFDRIPISMMNHNWFLENISLKKHLTYDSFKRLLDIVVSFVLGVISLIFYPFVYLAIKTDDEGSLFYVDERIGRNNRKFKLIKFRSMREKDGGAQSISRVGNFLRKTRIDELPQLWNVLIGDLSLIGPRPERTDLSKVYDSELAFYNIRHIIKPGLSGWAQLKQENHPHHVANSVATKEKLSYDLYYIKNRSILLDLKIALQTINILLSRKGR